MSHSVVWVSHLVLCFSIVTIAVCVQDIIKEGRELFYFLNGKKTKIERIYNRVIFDELLNKKLDLKFSFSDDLDIQWVGHPNWFYKISKYSLPLINSKYNPKCYYLDHLDILPVDLENYEVAKTKLRI